MRVFEAKEIVIEELRQRNPLDFTQLAAAVRRSVMYDALAHLHDKDPVAREAMRRALELQRGMERALQQTISLDERRKESTEALMSHGVAEWKNFREFFQQRYDQRGLTWHEFIRLSADARDEWSCLKQESDMKHRQNEEERMSDLFELWKNIWQMRSEIHEKVSESGMEREIYDTVFLVWLACLELSHEGCISYTTEKRMRLTKPDDEQLSEQNSYPVLLHHSNGGGHRGKAFREEDLELLGLSSVFSVATPQYPLSYQASTAS